ncbi:MAG: hypothetical protein EBS50_09220 [Sphingomonadaceae bacterium]|nr:hypothetical protein [Sphingomonadaceae bacterium]
MDPIFLAKGCKPGVKNSALAHQNKGRIAYQRGHPSGQTRLSGSDMRVQGAQRQHIAHCPKHDVKHKHQRNEPCGKRKRRGQNFVPWPRHNHGIAARQNRQHESEEECLYRPGARKISNGGP